MNELSIDPSPSSVTLQAYYRARDYVAVPAFLGGTIHGALGHALESLRASHILMAPEPPSEAPGFVRAGPPPPVVTIPPPIAAPRELAPGESLEFGLLAIAPDAARIGALLAALEAMGRRGLGRGRGRLELIRVGDSHDRTVWRDGNVVSEPAPDEDLTARGTGPWTLRTRTPLHLVREGKLVTSPTASDVARAAARRLVSLAWTYGGFATMDLRVCDRATSEHLIAASDCDWQVVRGERWSERQGRHHPMEGVLGSMHLGAGFEPYLPWLERSLRFGLGKGAGLGLGRLELVLRS